MLTKMPLSFLGFVAFLLSAAVPVATADTRIRAGAAKVDVTPPLPAIYDLMQVATRIGQPLHARVLYLEDDDDRVVFVATDCEGLLRSAYEAIRSAVSGATGVPPRHIVVNSNHSHMPTGGQSQVVFKTEDAAHHPEVRFIAADVVNVRIPSHHDPNKLARLLIKRVWEA